MWARYTTEHETSEQAVGIGLGQISAMSRAVGVMAWDHETELIGAVGECKVGVQRDDPERNEVKGWVIDSENRGAPVYNRARQAQGAEQHDVNRKGGQLRQATANMPPPAPPHPADFDDSEIPF